MVIFMKSEITLGLVLLTLGMTSAQAALRCTALTQSDKNNFSVEAKWRTAMTNGDFVPTSKAREADVRSEVASLVSTIRGDATPAYRLIPAEKTMLNQTKTGQGYQTGTVDRFEIKSLSSDGQFKATLALPVSAHNGLAKAQTWAKTDTYTVYAVEGDMHSYSSTPFFKITGKSLDLVTLQEISIKVPKGKLFTIFYYRSGSAGVGGYIEGRAIEFIYK